MSWEDGFKFSTAILISLGGGVAIVFGFSSWLGKVWAARILGKEKNDLEKLKKEHEIRFSRLHLARAEAIKDIAQKLQQLDDSLHAFLKHFQPVNEPKLEEKISNSIQIHNEFVALYKKRRIYFKLETAQLMHKIALCSRDTYVNVNSAISVSSHAAAISYNDDEMMINIRKRLLSDRDEFMDEARKCFSQDLERLIEQLENIFRQGGSRLVPHHGFF